MKDQLQNLCPFKDTVTLFPKLFPLNLVSPISSEEKYSHILLLIIWMKTIRVMFTEKSVKDQRHKGKLPHHENTGVRSELVSQWIGSIESVLTLSQLILRKLRVSYVMKITFMRR